MPIKPTPEEVKPLIRSYLSEKEERAWLGLLETYERIVRELDRRLLREHRLPLKTFETLIQLAHTPGEEMAISELAEQAMLSPSRMSRLVMQLERDGLVARRRSSADARSTFAAITPKGKETLLEAAPTYLTTVRRLLIERLSKNQVAQLATIWQRVPPADGADKRGRP